MRIAFAIVVATLAGPSAQAEATYQAMVFENPDFPSHVTCFSINSRLGWQRVAMPSFSDGVRYWHIPAEDMPNSVAQEHWGWSVDDARYDRVGVMGHSGSAAKSLEPFSDYKLYKQTAFGAVLFRFDGNNIRWMAEYGDFLDFKPYGTLEMRINDADNALGDNGGSALACFGQRPK